MSKSAKPKSTKPKIVAMIVASAIIMQQIDATVITTALPQMAISLNSDPVALSVAVTAYLLSVAVFIPVSGWAADRFGGRTIFRAAIAVFTLGSVLCGLSNSAIELTAARVLQGLGGAMMVPVGRLVLFRSIERSELVRTMAYLQVPAQLGPVLGPPIGGFITTFFSWRWIFLVNVPLGILGIVLVTRFFDNPKEDAPRPMDWTGFLLTGVALACILYGIEAIGRGFGGVGGAVALLVVGALAGALALWHLRRASHPLLDPAIFRIPTFRASIGGGSLFRAGAGSLVFLLPLLLQVVFGMTAFASGTLTFATAVGAMSMKATARPILKRFGFRNVIEKTDSSSCDLDNLKLADSYARRNWRVVLFVASVVIQGGAADAKAGGSADHFIVLSGPITYGPPIKMRIFTWAGYEMIPGVAMSADDFLNSYYGFIAARR